jgi:hypothetical protein
MAIKHSQELTDDLYVHHFESLLGLSSYLEDNWQAWRDGNKPGGSFKDCMSQTAAKKILKKGGHWDEGAQRMTRARIDAGKFPMLKSAMPVPAPAVAGYRANVPAFLAGSPVSMVRNTDVEMSDRRCRMLVAVNASASVKHDTLLNRGAAIMGAIEAMENEGYSVELTVGFLTGSSIGEAHFLVKVKDYCDTFNPASLAFVLAEPSFFRRSLFALFEIDRVSDPENPILDEMEYGLGYPLGTFDDKGYNIVFEPLHGGERWTPANSADKAMEKVFDWLERSKVAA